MYNVLIVDDEPGHLTGLSKIIRRLRPSYTVQTAKNGEEALSICDADDFQIIITDIQMPIMDGLEFYERLPSSHQPQKVIFLSGFDYFEYAQKAIGLGSFEYVLKPVDIDKFTKVLEKAERSIEEELSSLHENEQMSAKLNAIVPLYHNRILSDWINAVPLSHEDEQELQHSLLFQGGGSIVVTEIKGADKMESLELKSCKSLVNDAMQSLLGEHGAYFSFFPEHNRNTLISVTNVNLSEPLLMQVEDHFKDKNNVNANITIGVSSWSDMIYKSAPQLYKEACHAAMESFYTMERILFRGKHTKIDPWLFLKPNARQEAQFSEAIHAADGQNKLNETTRMLVAKLLGGERYPTPAELITYGKKLLKKLTEALEYIKPDVREQLLSRITESFGDVFHFEQFQDVIAERLADISAAITEARRDSKEMVIYKCLTYINEHYMDDLSLESVAGVFHFNSSYFCHYFKSKLNINFSQYLTQVRLTKAKELLEKTDGKIYQVASQLGYQDVKYFNRVFKKEYGLTPEEFRTIARSMKRV